MNKAMIGIYTTGTMVATCLGVTAFVPHGSWLPHVVIVACLLTVVMWVAWLLLGRSHRFWASLAGMTGAIFVAVCYLSGYAGGKWTSAVPSRANLQVLVEVLGNSWQQVIHESLPLPTWVYVDPLILVAVAVMVILSLVMALYISRPVWVGVPALIAWIILVSMESSTPMIWVLLTCVSFMGLISVAPRINHTPAGFPWVAIPVVAVALICSLAMPSVVRSIPGWGGGFPSLVGVGSDRASVTVEGPIQVTDQLRTQSTALVISIRGDYGGVLPMMSFEIFDGHMWRAQHSGLYGYRLGDDVWSDAFRHRRSDVASGWVKQGELSIINRTLTGRTIPTAPGPRSVVSTSDMFMQYETGSDGFFAHRDLRVGDTYSVGFSELERSVVVGVQPSPELFREIHSSRDPQGNQADFAHITQIRSLTEQIVGEASTQDEMLQAIQGYLRGPNFSYSLYPSWRSNDPVWGFLTTGQGYCVHFATAMAIMAESVGIPMRVSAGFLIRQSSDGLWSGVYGNQAHLWPEAYYPEVGWVRYEPTPAAPLPDERREPVVIPVPLPTNEQSLPAPDPSATTAEPSSSPTHRLPVDTDSPQGTAGLWGVGVAFAGLAGVVGLLVWIRTYHLERAWRRIMRRGVRSGVLTSGMTVRQVTARLNGLTPQLSEDLTVLRDQLEFARYGLPAEADSAPPWTGARLFLLTGRIISPLRRYKPLRGTDSPHLVILRSEATRRIQTPQLDN